QSTSDGAAAAPPPSENSTSTVAGDGGIDIAQTGQALTIHNDQTCVDFPLDKNVPPGVQSAWFLQLIAINQCILSNKYGSHTPPRASSSAQASFFGTPWAGPGAFHVFNASKIKSCEDVVAIQ